jgi:hypothetical protein
MKIKNKLELIDFIDSDRTWRRRELTNLKLLVTQIRGAHKDLVVRSSIVMLSSHWEGFVKCTAKAFINFLVCKGIRYEQLKTNYHVAGLIGIMNGDNSQNKTWCSKDIHVFLTNEIGIKNFFVDEDKYINPKGNLNSDMLKEILYKIGIPEVRFQVYFTIIDSILLKNRNEIAHGENTAVRGDSLDLEGFLVLYEKIYDLMELYYNELSNHITTDSYLI